MDGSGGRALIDPERAVLALDYDRSSQSGTFDDADATQEAFLRRHGEQSVGLVFNRSLRYREGIIQVGERLVALGSIRRAPDAEARDMGTPAGAASPLLRLGGSPGGRLILSDSPEAAGRA